MQTIFDPVIFDPTDTPSALTILKYEINDIRKSMQNLEKNVDKINECLMPILDERRADLRNKDMWRNRWNSLIIALTIIGAIMGALKICDEIYLNHKNETTKSQLAMMKQTEKIKNES